jgi:DNA-binding beta-propeller fold protein YncE
MRTLGLCFALALFSSCTANAQTLTPGVVTTAVELPSGKPGIGFDDLQWSDQLGRVIVPGGRSGNVYLIDPESLAITTLGGFSKSADYEGGHDFGVTSAVEADGFLYATDRTATSLVQVELAGGKRTHSISLQAEPDYVRFVAKTRELWVTEPHGRAIEIFALDHATPPGLRLVAKLDVPGGPEALVIDAEHGVAYTNSFTGTTYTIDLQTRKVVAQFKNSCLLSLGLALDAKNRRLYVACGAGAVAVFAADSGAALGRVEVGRGVDIIAFDAKHQRAWIPSSAAGELRSVQWAGAAPRVLGRAKTASGSSCVISDDHGRAWVCDPKHGRMLRVTFP